VKFGANCAMSLAARRDGAVLRFAAVLRAALAGAVLRFAFIVQHTEFACHAGLQMQVSLGSGTPSIQSACGYLTENWECGWIVMFQRAEARRERRQKDTCIGRVDGVEPGHDDWRKSREASDLA
jgi:hypothetical protein